MRAIGFLVAAFLVLAACNRPIPADRSVAAVPASAARSNAPPAAREPPASQAEARNDSEAPVADDRLTERVREALIAEKGLTARDLEVTTKNGVVTLSGKIEERSDQDRMMLVAMSIEGVRSVVSHLVLDRPA